MSTQAISDNFRIIERSAKTGIERLKKEDTWSSKVKANGIEKAVHRLALLIILRYPMLKLDTGACKELLSREQVTNQQDGCLDNLNAMLDCKASALRT